MRALVQRPEADSCAAGPWNPTRRQHIWDIRAATRRGEMSEGTAVRLRISGRVQGVAYRAWVERQASLLFLSGWVRNRRDGSVEAVLCGPEEAVRDMVERCRRGPSLARVAAVTEQVETAPVAAGFRQLPTL
jgi:acylphosphatase